MWKAVWCVIAIASPWTIRLERPQDSTSAASPSDGYLRPLDNTLDPYATKTRGIKSLATRKQDYSKSKQFKWAPWILFSYYQRLRTLQLLLNIIITLNKSHKLT